MIAFAIIPGLHRCSVSKIYSRVALLCLTNPLRPQSDIISPIGEVVDTALSSWIGQYEFAPWHSSGAVYPRGMLIRSRHVV